jgi:hypothetical protein
MSGRRWVRRIALAGLVGLAISSSGFVNAGVTAAATPDDTVACLTFNGSKLDGYYWIGNGSDGNTVEGVSATIITRNPDLCNSAASMDPHAGYVSDPDHNWHYVWVMLENNALLGGLGWAQVGYERRTGDSVTYYTTQYSEDGSTFTNTVYTSITGPTYGSSHTYMVRWSTDTGDLYLSSEVQRYATTPWDPYTVWTQPFGPVFAGETKYCGSPMPGTPSNLAVFSNTQFENQADDFTSDEPGGETSTVFCHDDGHYRQSSYSDNSFSIYTDS